MFRRNKANATPASDGLLGGDTMADKDLRKQIADTWYNRPGPSLTFRQWFWSVALLVFLGFMAALVTPIFRYGWVILAHDGAHESQNYQGDHIVYPDNYDPAWAQPSSNVSYMVATIKIVSLDLINERFTVAIQLTDLRGSSTPTNLLTRGITILSPELEKTATGQRDYTAGKDYMPIYISDTKLFEDGNLNMYPFDNYHATIGISVFDRATNASIPVVGVFEGGIPGYRLHVVSHGTNFQLVNPVVHLREAFLTKGVADNSVLPIPGVTFRFQVERSVFTLSWSLFVISLMWIISVVQLCIALQFYLRGREFSVGLMTFGSSFLFSLPSFRNTQPNIPSVGCAADALGFYYNMCFVVLAICLNIKMYLESWKLKAPGDKDKKEEADKGKDDKKDDKKDVKDAKNEKETHEQDAKDSKV